MDREKIVILGGGNGALGFAAYLGLRGRKAFLWEFPEFRKDLAQIYERGRIVATGVVEGETEVECCDELGRAIWDAGIVMVVVPAFAHRRLAIEIAPYLEENTILVLNPGRTGGALEVAAVLKEKGKKTPIAETQSLLFACRRKGEGGVHFNGVKRSLRVGVFPSKHTSEVVGRLRQIFPQFQPVPDVLTTSLGNIGAVFHPPSALMNVGVIESGRTYDYYRETMTPAVVRVIEEVDRERMSLARVVGAEVFSVQSWLRDSYQLGEAPLYQMLRENPAYQGVAGPHDIHTRYITEDVPTGLVPMESIGMLYHVSTPTISGLISVANSMIGVDFRVSGRNLDRLGLRGMVTSDIPTFLREGEVLRS